MAVFALRPAAESDIPAFYEQQMDEPSWRMAGITPRVGEAFVAHWKKVLADGRNRNYAILADGVNIGHVACFPANWEGPLHVGYWVARAWWGKGAASFAVGELLRIVKERPLRATISPDNAASRRVLEKHGFRLADEPAGDGRPGLVLRLD